MINNLSLYRSFAAVAKLGGISAAAQELGVSQPAVSTDISKLERQLGVTLFVRTNRGMKLTSEGELLYSNISDAFSFIEAGESAIKKTNALTGGHLRIGASDMTLRFFLLDYIERFCRLYPGVKLSVTNNPTPQTLSALRDGSIDFGVISQSDQSLDNCDDLEMIPLRPINDIFVCPPDHPLANRKGLTADHLRDYPLIMLEKNTGTRKYLKKQPGFEDLEADIELATSDLIIEFATRGIGIASVVEDFALEKLKNRQLVKLDMKSPPAPRYFILARLKRRPLPAAAAKIIEIITLSKKM